MVVTFLGLIPDKITGCHAHAITITDMARVGITSDIKTSRLKGVLILETFLLIIIVILQILLIIFWIYSFLGIAKILKLLPVINQQLTLILKTLEDDSEP